jgi:hypothetical protein
MLCIFKLEFSSNPTYEMSLDKDDSLTCPMWLWGYSLLKVSSPGTLVYATSWLQRYLFEQYTALRSKCRIVEGSKQKGMHSRSLMVVEQRPVKIHPLFIHSFIIHTVGAVNNPRPQYRKWTCLVALLGDQACRLWSAVLAKHGCGTSYDVGRCCIGPLHESSLVSNILVSFLFMNYILDC